MSAHIRVMRLLCTLTALTVCALPAGRTSAAQEQESVVVLDTYSSWRIHDTLKPPVVDAGDRLEPRLREVEWLDSPTPEPPADWYGPDFDDSGWLRMAAVGGARTPYLSRECLRGKFRVTDPRQVRGLSVSVKYHGGAVVYVNGTEVARSHLPAGGVTEATLAEGYPLDVYVDEAGDLIADSGTYTGRGRKAGNPSEDERTRMAARVRSIGNVPVPPSLLRSGVNVLAVELVRAPYHKVMLESQEEAGGKRRHNKYDWCTGRLVEVQLTAASSNGLVPNAARPAGFQVWNSDPLAADCDFDFGDPCEPLRPIELVGTRNGSFSGKVVVGSTQPLLGLKATVGDLTGQAGTIPASAVSMGYGYKWGTEMGLTYRNGPMSPPYAQWPSLFGAVTHTPPAEAPIRQVRGQAAPGAVLPVWVTVRVPRDAAPGVYAGRLTIRANGVAPVAVPVRLQVVDWALPDPQDYRTWVELVEVPDTPAAEYDVPLWSDEHFEMIAEAFRLISDTGTRVVYVPVIAHTNLGNMESMVRWIKTGENQYDWDFSAMDRYLDLAQQHLGEPKIVVLQVWDVYMSSEKSIGKRFGLELEERHSVSGGAPQVTLLDRTTGQTENIPLPPLTDPASKAIWQDLLGRVRSRLQERGLGGTEMLGMFTDAVPPREHVEFFQEIAPDVPWVQQGHGRWQKKLYDIAEVGYQATVWGGFRFADGLRQTNQRQPPIMESLHGWQGPKLDAVFERNTSLDTFPPTRWYFFPETGITSELRGIGRIGADYWRVVKDKRDRRVGWAHNRFTEGQWGGSSINLNLCNPVLAPGPDGPVATQRLIALRQGVQACEARICLERALTDDALRAKLGPDLTARAERVLDERLSTMWKTLSNYQLGGPMFFGATAWRWTAGVPGHRWFLGSGWQQRDRELFELAGEVTRRLNGE